MLIRRLLQYLVEHPEAKDTLEGIRRWWLSRDRQAPDDPTLQEALESLVARGWLTQRRTGLSHTLYGLHRPSLKEIEAFLEAADNDRPRSGDHKAHRKDGPCQ